MPFGIDSNGAGGTGTGAETGGAGTAETSGKLPLAMSGDGDGGLAIPPLLSGKGDGESVGGSKASLSAEFNCWMAAPWGRMNFLRTGGGLGGAGTYVVAASGTDARPDGIPMGVVATSGIAGRPGAMGRGGMGVVLICGVGDVSGVPGRIASMGNSTGRTTGTAIGAVHWGGTGAGGGGGGGVHSTVSGITSFSTGGGGAAGNRDSIRRIKSSNALVRMR